MSGIDIIMSIPQEKLENLKRFMAENDLPFEPDVREEPGETIRYTIDIPERAILEMESLMRRHGAHFNSRMQVTAINDAFMDHSTAMGNHIPDLLAGMNHFLEAEDLNPTAPTDHNDWDIPRIQQFLIFAVEEFVWENNQVVHAWWQDIEKPWEEVVEEYSRVFGANQ